MKVKIAGQFSGVGAFDEACYRVFGKDNVENIYQAEWDKYARTTYLANHKEPKFYVKDVYDTPFEEIEPVDIFMSSAPCQAFSLAGKRLGKDDDKGRGILFFQSHKFIQINKPRYFIFENVKGLLSDDAGKTFSEWVNMLGGKSINGNDVLFPYPDSVPYHIYYQVLNSKDYGVPQNRERIFIVGIRDDSDNTFTFPKEEFLAKRLKDVLETNVDEKYYLSGKNVENLLQYNKRQEENNRGFSAKFRDVEKTEIMDALKVGGKGKDDLIQEPTIYQTPRGNNKGGEHEICPTITTNSFEHNNHLVEPKILGYTRDEKGKVIKRTEKDCAGTIHTASGGGGNTDQFVIYDDYNGRIKDDQSCFGSVTTNIGNGAERNGQKVIEVKNTDKIIATYRHSFEGFKGYEDLSPTIKASEGSGNQIILLNNAEHSQQRIYSKDGIAPSILSGSNGGGQTPCKHLTNEHRIRRLTPRECFRLQDFSDTFDISKVSETQAYKQAGNSITVAVLEKIIKKLKL
jgi:DNA (cytosine-5)-methyltransferase 1